MRAEQEQALLEGHDQLCAAGVLHRDPAPRNWLLPEWGSTAGRPLICDFDRAQTNPTQQQAAAGRQECARWLQERQRQLVHQQHAHADVNAQVRSSRTLHALPVSLTAPSAATAARVKVQQSRVVRSPLRWA